MKTELSRTILPLAVLAIVAACSGAPTGPGSGTTRSDRFTSGEPNLDARGPVTHHVTLGGADICEAVNQPTGCDANFSLVATEYADGTVRGQWHDQFSGGRGVHVDITCLAVNGNEAVVGGIVKNSTSSVFEIGDSVLTAVVDNGTSRLDPPDELGFTLNTSLWPSPSCHATSVEDLRRTRRMFALTSGQVKVR